MDRAEIRYNYDITFYYGLPFVKTATLNKLNVDAGLNVRFIDLNAEVKQSAIQVAANPPMRSCIREKGTSSTGTF